jgi:hypothetical protein
MKAIASVPKILTHTSLLKALANYYEANCCAFALFGNEDSSAFQSYCALYQITEFRVAANPAPEGKGITAFYSSTLMTGIDLIF